MTPASFNALPTQVLSRSIDKCFEDAQFYGVLVLAGRNLKQLPAAAVKYDLSDTVSADLSRNRVEDLPSVLCELSFLHSLYVHHNTLRHLPPSIGNLCSLTYLDLSHNLLSVLPYELCSLPLQVLLLAHNRLNTLPVEISSLADTLLELDVSNNDLNSLPPELGELHELRVLDVSDNQLRELPADVCRCLQLRSLNTSHNQLTCLPPDLYQLGRCRLLDVSSNPLQLPQATDCTRGAVHVFKRLQTEYGNRSSVHSAKRNVTNRTQDWCHRSASLNRTNMNTRVDMVPLTRSSLIDRRTRNTRFNTVSGDSGFESVTGGEDSVDNANIGIQPMSRSINQTQKLSANTNALLYPTCSDGSFTQEVMTACLQQLSTTCPLSSANAASVSHNTSRTVSETTITDDSPTPKATPDRPEPPNQGQYQNRMAHSQDARYQQMHSSNLRAALFTANQSQNLRDPEPPRLVSTGGLGFQPRTTLTVNNTIHNNPTASINGLGNNQRPNMLQVNGTVANCLGNTEYVKQSFSLADVLSRNSPISNRSAANNSGNQLSLAPPPQAIVKPLTPVIEGETGEAGMLGVNGSHSRLEMTPKAIHNNPESTLDRNANPQNLMNGKSEKKIDVNGNIKDSCTVTPVTVTNSNGNTTPTVVVKPRVLKTEDKIQVSNGDKPKTNPPTKPGLKTGGASGPNMPPPPKQPITSRITDNKTNSSRPVENKTNPARLAANKTNPPVKKSPPINGLGTNSRTNSTNNNISSNSSDKSIRPSTSATNKCNTNTVAPRKTSNASSTSSLLSVASNRTNTSTTSFAQNKRTVHSAGNIGIGTTNRTGNGRSTVTSSTSAVSRPSTAGSSASNSRRPSNASTTSNTTTAVTNSNTANAQATIDKMRKCLEKYLSIELPSERNELASALSNGMLLCQFVNVLRPRTLSAVHTPVDTETALSAPKSRRNIENFLMACRRLGVPESQLFQASDVLEGKQTNVLAKSVLALARLHANTNNTTNCAPKTTITTKRAPATAKVLVTGSTRVSDV